MNIETMARALFTRAAEVRDGDGDGYVNDGTPQERLASEWDRKLKGLRNRRGENKDGVSMAVTETPEFKAWFGDSKVVDENGKPQILYHATTSDFTEFSNPYAESNITMASSSPEYTNLHISGQGKHSRSMPIFVQAERPLDLREIPSRRGDARNRIIDVLKWDADEGTQERQDAVKAISAKLEYERDAYAIVNRSFRSKAMRDLLYKAGYDSIVMNDHRENVDESTGKMKDVEAQTWVVFNPRQIKSATGNSGRFDRESADISKSLFSIAAMFKAADIRDGDGDGIIYDGTPQERMARQGGPEIDWDLFKTRHNQALADGRTIHNVSAEEYLKIINPDDKIHSSDLFGDGEPKDYQEEWKPSDFPILLQEKDGVEYRMSGEQIQYVKYDDNDNIVRDSRGLAEYLSDDEARQMGRAIREVSIKAFDKETGKYLGYVGDSFGAVELEVLKRGRGRGIGSELSYLNRKLNPFKQSGGFSPEGKALAEKAYWRIVNGGMPAELVDALREMKALNQQLADRYAEKVRPLMKEKWDIQGDETATTEQRIEKAKAAERAVEEMEQWERETWGPVVNEYAAKIKQIRSRVPKPLTATTMKAISETTRIAEEVSDEEFIELIKNEIEVMQQLDEQELGNASAGMFKSVDIRDGDGDGLIYDGTHLERPVNTQAKDLIDGQSIVIPESFTYGKIEDAKVESIEDGKIAIYRSYVSGDGTPTKHVLAEGTQKEIRLLLNDLAGVLDHPADSGNPVLDAALSGRAEYLGRGHGGVVFGVGDKVVKASSIVPFHWNNGLRNEKGANDKLMQEAEIVEELKSAGVPGVLPLEVIEHDGRVFAIRDKISLDGIDQQAIDDAGKALQVMHDAGYATHDQIQIGMGSDGKFRFFDVSEATKIDPKSPYAREDMDSDHSSLKRFAEKLGLKHENPRDLYADVKLEKAITDALTYREGKTDAGGYRDHEMALREALHRMKTMMPDTLSFYEEETKKLIAEMRDGWRAISAAEKAAKAAT